MRLISLIGILCMVILAPALAADQEPPRVIRIDGSITANTLFEVSKGLSGWKNHDPIPGGLIVLLNSPGGDGEAAMQIGRNLRQKNAHVFVIGRCESACVFVLAGGVVRAARKGSVGVHAGRLAVADSNGRIVKELDVTNSLEGSFKLTQFNSEIRNYFAEMGISHGLLDVVLAHQTRQTYKLSDQEMRCYRLVGFNEVYMNHRLKSLEILRGMENVSSENIYKRTLSVPSLCQKRYANNSTFVNCYKEVLFGKLNRI